MRGEERRGPRWPPPAARTERPRRGVALLVLVVVLGTASLFIVRVGPRRPGPARAAPFEAGSLYGSRPTGARAPVAVPGVLLYVDDACPLCARELDRWARAAAAAHVPRLPTVVVSPRSNPAGGHVPASLRDGMLHDADGSIARALGVRAVPFRAVMDGGGTVVAVHVGVSAPADISPLVGPAAVASEGRAP
jgi:hypothetical protein